ncbi:hypothetical protein LCGC14_0814930 [marine sediment metagenome]|uniref:Elp3/MiaA/NifB-like radical SAM core domain-containing protein n=1 Tax=marine sediment metagenome TaxID=412755 RepID=A0A0F9ST58_9ZZZZ
MKYCFLQVSDRLLNPDDKSNPADNYFKAIWPNMADEGYYRPKHFWEIPTWIAELAYCLNDRNNELELFHIDIISRDRHYPILPEADFYLASVMDCNKEYFRVIAKNNPDKEFRFGGYIGYVEFSEYFKGLNNVVWYLDIKEFCKFRGIKYQYGTDYSLFKGTKCIPRLTLSNGCTNHCRFCTVPDEIKPVSWNRVLQQIMSFRDLDFELIYINDKTFGQCDNYRWLGICYRIIKKYNPKFQGFTIQTTCHQIIKFNNRNKDLKPLYVVNVELGIESFNNSILNKYSKPQNTSTIDLAVFILEKMGVNIIPNIIIGLPGENLFTYWATLDWLNDNKQNFLMLNITNFVPYVGNEVSTVGQDLNENSMKCSYHTPLEAAAVRIFTESLFDIGMEIIEATKARSI